MQTLATGNQQSIHWNAKNSREDLKVQHLGSTIAAQGDLTLQAGNDLSAQAASLSAAKDATLRLSAGRDLSLQAGIDQVSSQTRHAYKSKSGINYETLNASGWQSTVAAAELSAGQIELQSGRDATLGAIEANADSLRIHTGGQLKLQTASTLEQSARQATAGSSVSVSASGKGATDETLRYNQLNARQLSIDAKGGPVTASVMTVSMAHPRAALSNSACGGW